MSAANIRHLQSTFHTTIGESFTDVDPRSDGIGSFRFENGSIYRLVKYSGSTDLADGDVVAYAVEGGTAGTVGFYAAVVEVADATAPSNLTQPAGVVRLDTTLDASTGTDHYFWVQCYGIGAINVTNTVTNAANTYAVGDYLQLTSGGVKAVEDTDGPAGFWFQMAGTTQIAFTQGNTQAGGAAQATVAFINCPI